MDNILTSRTQSPENNFSLEKSSISYKAVKKKSKEIRIRVKKYKKLPKES